jgi:hypothetical protein
MKRKHTAEEDRIMAQVAAMGCLVCERMGYPGTPAQLHHVRARHGWGRSSHKAIIPLCWEHHQGKTGVHSMGREQFRDMYGKSEIELLEIILNRLLEGGKHES